MGLISRNVELKPPLKSSSWRKIAIGTWRSIGDPSTYGIFEVNAKPSLDYLEKLRTQTGQRITLTHVIGKAIAQTLERHPDLNCILRWGKLYPRKTIDLFFQVANDTHGQDLSGTIIREANHKSIPEIAQEMEQAVETIRKKGDPHYRKMKGMMHWMPGLIMGPLLKIISFLTYNLNLWSPLLGTPKDPFGGVMITNIGSLGLDMALGPLVPYSRVPVVIAVGAVRDTPVVEDGKIVIQPIIKLGVTIDHRLIDGVHGSYLAKRLTEIFKNPEKELSHTTSSR